MSRDVRSLTNQRLASENARDLYTRASRDGICQHVYMKATLGTCSLNRPMASIAADLDGYDCAFLEPPPDALLCLICTFVAREPMQMDCCGRVYCKHCFNEHKKLSQQCPHCRKDGNGFSDRKSEREINALKLRCSNFKNGCKWMGELVALQKHLTTCDHALLPCPNECKAITEISQLLRKDLEAHLKHNCPNRSYECPHCKQEGKHHDITTSHLENCPKVAITCPNMDCGEEINRCDMTEHQKECSFHVVPCKFTKIGCGEKRIRKEVEGHEKSYETHFHLAMETVLKIRNDMETVLKMQKKTMETVLKVQKETMETVHNVRKETMETVHKVQKENEKRFSMAGFNTHKLCSLVFLSQPFYCHGRYKLSVRVDANGIVEGKGTHVSVFVHFMKGDFDDSLTWPFTGSVTFTLLNQLEDKHHHEVAVAYPQGRDDDTNRRVVAGEKSGGFGHRQFISHEALRYNAVTNCQHLKDDCLYFRVAVTPDRVKPWLTPTV